MKWPSETRPWGLAAGGALWAALGTVISAQTTDPATEIIADMLAIAGWALLIAGVRRWYKARLR